MTNELYIVEIFGRMGPSASAERVQSACYRMIQHTEPAVMYRDVPDTVLRDIARLVYYYIVTVDWNVSMTIRVPGILEVRGGQIDADDAARMWSREMLLQYTIGGESPADSGLEHFEEHLVAILYDHKSCLRQGIFFPIAPLADFLKKWSAFKSRSEPRADELGLHGLLASLEEAQEPPPVAGDPEWPDKKRDLLLCAIRAQWYLSLLEEKPKLGSPGAADSKVHESSAKKLRHFDAFSSQQLKQFRDAMLVFHSELEGKILP